jgi:hypothetical protein
MKPLHLRSVAQTLNCDEGILRQIINEKRLPVLKHGQGIRVWPREVLRLRRLVRHSGKGGQ